jgi:hypothetical protein
MAKPILTCRGLSIVSAQDHHVVEACKNLSSENRKEFEVVYGGDPLELMMQSIESEMMFAIMREHEVLGITGISDCGSFSVMWAVFTEGMRNHKVSFVRASEALVRFYHKLSPNLECRVWIENNMICQWLAFLGFTPDIVFEAKPDVKMVNFVRCVDPEFEIDNSASRPVMH